MPGGSGGADAIRMINRQAREAARYRQERRERRASMRAEGNGVFGTGELQSCHRCHVEWDHDFLLRVDEQWVCELCNAAQEADVEVQHDHGSLAGLLAGFIGAMALFGPLTLELSTGGPFLAWIVVCVVAGPGLLAWARGLIRSGYDSLGLRAAAWVGLSTLFAPGVVIAAALLG